MKLPVPGNPKDATVKMAQDHRESRHHLIQPPIVVDRPVMRAVVQHPGDEEQGAGGNPVIDHLEDGALDALSVEPKNTQGDEPHMRDGRIGDESFEVRLREGHGAAVENGQHGEPLDERGERRRGFRKYGETEPDQPVGPHLQQEPGENDAARGGRLPVRVGDPAMNGEHGHLDGKP